MVFEKPYLSVEGFFIVEKVGWRPKDLDLMDGGVAREKGIIHGPCTTLSICGLRRGPNRRETGGLMKKKWWKLKWTDRNGDRENETGWLVMENEKHFFFFFAEISIFFFARKARKFIGGIQGKV